MSTVKVGTDYILVLAPTTIPVKVDACTPCNLDEKLKGISDGIIEAIQISPYADLNLQQT